MNLSSVSDTASLVSAINNAISTASTGSAPALGSARPALWHPPSRTPAASTLVHFQHVGVPGTGGGQDVQRAVGELPRRRSIGAGSRYHHHGGGRGHYQPGGADHHGFRPGRPREGFDFGLRSLVPGRTDHCFHVGNVSDAIGSLQTQVASSSALQAAAISFSVAAGTGALQFKSASGESLSVMATGDINNQLGLGSFVTNTSSHSAVQYSSIQGSAKASFNATTNNQATVEVSINGGAATSLSVNLTDKDLGATAAKTTTTTALDATAIRALEGKVLTVSVDGISATTATLDGGAPATTSGSVNLQSSAVTVAAATFSKTVGHGAMTVGGSTDWASTKQSFTVNVNGGGAQTINLTTNYSAIDGAHDSALQTEIQGQLTGATVSVASGVVSFTATTAGAGAGGGIVIGGAAAATLRGGGAWDGATTLVGANGNNQIQIATNASGYWGMPHLLLPMAPTMTPPLPRW